MKTKPDSNFWKEGDTVEIYPGTFVKIVEVRSDRKLPGTVITYTCSKPLLMPMTRWQRIKAFFGWRPTIGY